MKSKTFKRLSALALSITILANAISFAPSAIAAGKTTTPQTPGTILHQSPVVDLSTVSGTSVTLADATTGFSVELQKGSILTPNVTSLQYTVKVANTSSVQTDIDAAFDNIKRTSLVAYEFSLLDQNGDAVILKAASRMILPVPAGTESFHSWQQAGSQWDMFGVQTTTVPNSVTGGQSFDYTSNNPQFTHFATRRTTPIEVYGTATGSSATDTITLAGANGSKLSATIEKSTINPTPSGELTLSAAETDTTKAAEDMMKELLAAESTPQSALQFVSLNLEDSTNPALNVVGTFSINLPNAKGATSVYVFDRYAGSNAVKLVASTSQDGTLTFDVTCFNSNPTSLGNIYILTQDTPTTPVPPTPVPPVTPEDKPVIGGTTGKVDVSSIPAGTLVTLKDEKTGLEAKVSKDALPAGVTSIQLTAAAPVDATVDVAVDAATSSIGLKSLQTLDITLVNQDGANISTLSGDIEITLPSVEGANTVVYFDDVNKIATDLSATVSTDKKFITFKTNHFSYYVLSNNPKLVNTPDTPNTTPDAPNTTPDAPNTNVTTPNDTTTNNPNTGGAFPVLLLVLVVISGAGIVILKKRQQA